MRQHCHEAMPHARLACTWPTLQHMLTKNAAAPTTTTDEVVITLTRHVALIFSGSNAGTPSGKSPMEPSARREAQKRRKAMELSATSKLHQTDRAEGHIDRAART